MARSKTYHIMFTDNEVVTLHKVIRDQRTCKTVLKRCQILLELDETRGDGLIHSQIAHTYAVCPAIITNTIPSYIKNGIANIIKYNISPNSSAALRKADGRTKAHLIPIACGLVPEGHPQMDNPALGGKSPHGTGNTHQQRLQLSNNTFATVEVVGVIADTLFS